MEVIKEIRLNRNKKFTVNYQSKGFDVGITYEPNGESFKDAYQNAQMFVNALEKKEIERIKQEVQ